MSIATGTTGTVITSLNGGSMYVKGYINNNSVTHDYMVLGPNQVTQNGSIARSTYGPVYYNAGMTGSRSLSMVTGQLPQVLGVRVRLTADNAGNVIPNITVSLANPTSPLIITLPPGYDCSELGVTVMVGATSGTSREPNTVYWEVTGTFSIQGVDKNGNVNYGSIVYVPTSYMQALYQFNPVLV
jgi:hypothetical protein